MFAARLEACGVQVYGFFQALLKSREVPPVVNLELTAPRFLVSLTAQVDGAAEESGAPICVGAASDAAVTTSEGVLEPLIVEKMGGVRQ